MGSILSQMDDVDGLARFLGVRRGNRVMTTMLLIGEVERGLPFASLAKVFDEVAPDEPKLRYTVVPRATFARKRSGGSRMSREQSDHVARVARVWMLALKVWKTPDEARAFLLRPHPMLENRRPIEVTMTTEGARLVEDILGRLYYGTAA
jgi:putative toxin-antitoxin system antitoxin component (TIGR02293 family)